MLKIFKPTDRIKLKIDDVTFHLAPLTWEERMKISEFDQTKAGVKIEDMAMKVFEVMKRCVKDVDGIEYADGTKYKLSFDESGELSASCVSDFMSSDMSSRLIIAAASYLQGVSSGKLLSPVDGSPIEGVEFEYAKKKASSKRTKPRPQSS